MNVSSCQICVHVLTFALVVALGFVVGAFLVVDAFFAVAVFLVEVDLVVSGLVAGFAVVFLREGFASIDDFALVEVDFVASGLLSASFLVLAVDVAFLGVDVALEVARLEVVEDFLVLAIDFLAAAGA